MNIKEFLKIKTSKIIITLSFFIIFLSIFPIGYYKCPGCGPATIINLLVKGEFSLLILFIFVQPIIFILILFILLSVYLFSCLLFDFLSRVEKRFIKKTQTNI